LRDLSPTLVPTALLITFLALVMLASSQDRWGTSQPIIYSGLVLACFGMAYMISLGLSRLLSRDGDQIVSSRIAFILALLICGLLYYAEDLAGALWASARDNVAHLSLKAHFENIAKGVLDSRDILYYASVTILSVAVGTFSLDSRRWT